MAFAFYLFCFFFWLTILSVVIVSRMLGLLFCIIGEILGTTIASAGNVLVTGACWLVHAAPDVILSLIGKIPSAVVARLIATIACADVLLYNVGNAARAGGASAGIFLMTDADGLLCLFGEVLDDAWVLTYRHADVTKGRTVNGDSHVAATEASHGPCCALVAHGSSHCGIPTI